MCLSCLFTLSEHARGGHAAPFFRRVTGLECVGPLRVVDTVTTSRIAISTGSLSFPDGPGLGLSLDEAKLEKAIRADMAVNRELVKYIGLKLD